MSELYKSLAGVYDELYQTLFDYDKEYLFYKNQLEKYGARSVIELGCGTGHLAKRFTEGGYKYAGIDLNEEMLTIARQRVPEAVFLKSNINRFTLSPQYEAAIITGRTISYLIKNKDIINCFKSIYKSLKPGGVIIFDAIDAADLFGNAKLPARDELEKTFENNTYKRLSTSTPNLKTGWTWDWQSVYFLKNNDNYEEIGRDFATLRCFTKDEIALFLKIAGFDLIDVIKKQTYAWQDYFYVGQKIL